MTTESATNLAGVLNQSALQWYATIAQRPVQTGLPSSTMRNVFGADFAGGPTIQGQTAGSLGPLLVIAVVVIGIVLIARR